MRSFVIAVLGFAALVAMAAPRGERLDGEMASVAGEPGDGADRKEQPRDRQASRNAAAGETVLTRAADGHFYAEVQINGRTIRCLVDTGASAIALSRDDAMRAGIDFDPARFHAVGTGASGQVKGAVVLIDEVRLGEERARQVPAVVLDSGLPVSLLGQSFLKRFGSVRIEGDRMTLG